MVGGSPKAGDTHCHAIANPFPFSSPIRANQTPHLYLEDKWKLSKKENTSSNSLSRTRSRSASSSASLIKNSSQRRCAFTRKCAALVKEQRARFYIMRRCVTMLICWRDYGDA
ncbi:hypothetical protein SASPL_138995 [Salvia splendens]|uniref:DVL protein n=1 Tax=Salvia splendens TaxID=180675 RepID=A0A8X8WY45_SALSN|nr:hypothetical protein SASPL_138995 [Salvia splendens]